MKANLQLQPMVLFQRLQLFFKIVVMIANFTFLLTSSGQE